MKRIFNRPQTYNAWSQSEKKWIADGWILSPVDGYPYWLKDGRKASDLIVVRSTGVLDIKGVEIYECDLVVPVKFNDIPNLVQYIQHGFYRVKYHNGKQYVNVLGSCQVRILGNAFEHENDFDPTLIGNCRDLPAL